jgi:hypothetical protein
VEKRELEQFGDRNPNFKDDIRRFLGARLLMVPSPWTRSRTRIAPSSACLRCGSMPGASSVRVVRMSGPVVFARHPRRCSRQQPRRWTSSCVDGWLIDETQGARGAYPSPRMADRWCPNCQQYVNPQRGKQPGACSMWFGEGMFAVGGAIAGDLIAPTQRAAPLIGAGLGSAWRRFSSSSRSSVPPLCVDARDARRKTSGKSAENSREAFPFEPTGVRVGVKQPLEAGFRIQCVVEAPGIEPGSEAAFHATSTSVVPVFISP